MLVVIVLRESVSIHDKKSDIYIVIYCGSTTHRQQTQRLCKQKVHKRTKATALWKSSEEALTLQQSKEQTFDLSQQQMLCGNA